MSSGAFGDDLQSTVLYDVNCAGNETGILSCSVSFSGTCTEHSAATICHGKLPILILPLFFNSLS